MNTPPTDLNTHLAPTSALDEAAVAAAAKWWADKYRSPVVIMNNGEPIASALGTSLANSEPHANAGQADAFQGLLHVAIAVHLAKTEDSHMYLGVDYHPDRTLTEACEAAGVSLRRLPWKTSMFIDRGVVKVREGYGADSRQIFPEVA